MKTFKQILILILILNTSLVVAQQRKYSRKKREATQHFSAMIGEGISLFTYDIDNSKKTPGLASTIGMGYDAKITDQWFFFTGLNFSYYSGKTKITDFADQYPLTPSPYPAEDFLFSINVYGIEEKQKVSYLTIPIMLRYNYPLNNNNSMFYGMGGFKIGFPVAGKAVFSFDEITTEGYSKYSQQTHKNEPDHGFSSSYNLSSSQKIKLNPSLSLAVEAGIGWKLTNIYHLNIGGYIDYGFTNIAKKTNEHVVEYNHSDPLLINVNPLLTTADKTHLFSFGITARIVMDYFSKR